jgi:PAS domain S-box-containing protein
MLAQSERLYSTIVNSLNGIIWEADGRTFQFSFVSPQAERILGYPAREWLEQPGFWAAHTHPEDRDWSGAFCRDAIERHRDHQFEYRMVAANGRVVWLHDIVTVKTLPDGSVRLWGIMIDVTQRKRAEEQLDERSRFEQLVADLSASLARTATGELDTAITQWHRRLVEYLGADRGAILEPKPEEVALEARHFFAAPGVPSFAFRLFNQEFPWITREFLAGRVTALRNAIDELPPEAVQEREFVTRHGLKSHLAMPITIGGTIICVLAFSSVRRYLEWPDSLQRRIQLFGEVLAGAILRRRAALGGPAEPGGPAGQGVAGVASGRAMVLVVDDEVAIRSITRRMLERAGYRVVEASDALEAISLMESSPNPFHLLLTDVSLPGISGGELARLARTLRPELKVVYFSGHLEDTVAGQHQLERDAAFLQKPFTSGDLLESVRAALA